MGGSFRNSGSFLFTITHYIPTRWHNVYNLFKHYTFDLSAFACAQHVLTRSRPLHSGETPSLYQVLPERRNERVGAAMMASTHTYDLPGKRPAAAGAAAAAAAAAGGEGVEVALDPSELDLVDTDAMAQRYEERMRETQLEKEDLSDMVAEHAAKQKVGP